MSDFRNFVTAIYVSLNVVTLFAQIKQCDGRWCCLIQCTIFQKCEKQKCINSNKHRPHRLQNRDDSDINGYKIHSFWELFYYCVESSFCKIVQLFIVRKEKDHQEVILQGKKSASRKQEYEILSGHTSLKYGQFLSWFKQNWHFNLFARAYLSLYRHTDWYSHLIYLKWVKRFSKTVYYCSTVCLTSNDMTVWYFKGTCSLLLMVY